MVAIDLVARTWRLQWLAQGVGSRLTFGESFRINTYAEAGATLTPMRVGGEPARLAGMLAAGVPASASFVAIAYEVITAWPVLLVIAAWIFTQYAPEWWATAGPQLASSVREGWHWLLAAVVASFAAWLAARRVAKALPRHVTRPLRSILVYWRGMPRWPLLASLPLSAVNVLTRVAILPVLALTLPDPRTPSRADRRVVCAHLQPAGPADAERGRGRGPRLPGWSRGERSVAEDCCWRGVSTATALARPSA